MEKLCRLPITSGVRDSFSRSTSISPNVSEIHFAARGSERFAGIDLERGVAQIPLLRGCAARFQCRTAFRHEAGDHMIFVGEVEAFDRSDLPELLFHRGRYSLAVPKASSPVPPPEFWEWTY